MQIRVENAVASIDKCLSQATNHFFRGSYGYDPDVFNEDHAIAEYYVERAFVELLVLVDHLSLQNVYRKVESILTTAQKKGFLNTQMGIDDPYLVWCEKIRMVLDGIAGVHGIAESAISGMRDVKDIIRRSVYTICDTSLFPKVPQNEADVHNRIEAILRCSYSDVKTKPSLTKLIKNFEPDTGILSARTLIEYKYINNKADAKRVVDQILADISGYKSKEWVNLLFVVYETRRIKSEDEWNKLLQQCGVAANCEAIVLSGDSK